MAAEFGDETPIFAYDKDGKPMKSSRGKPSTILDKMKEEYTKNKEEKKNE